MFNSNVTGYNALRDIMGAGRNGKANGPSDMFDIRGSFREMLANKTGMQDMLDKISERFPGMNVSKGKPGSGAEGTGKFFGTGAGDFAAIEENLLAAMSGNNGLFDQVQQALESFFNSAAGTSGMEGAYTQRSISITITTVRMNVSQRSEESGDLLSSQEFQTAFQEQLQGLINRFFGIEPTAESETDGDESGDDGSVAGAKGKEKGKAKGHHKDEDDDKTGDAGKNDWSGGYSAAGFSFEMFFSSALISKAQNQDGTWAAAQSMQMQFGIFSGSSISSGGFQNFANGMLPDILGRFMNQGNQGGGNGPFTSLLNGAFGQFGMSMSSFNMSAGGFSIKGGDSRDMISQMFEYLMSNRNNSYENDKTAEAENVTEVPEEVAAE